MSEQKIVVLKGSPRKRGNSSLIAERLAEGARSVGAGVQDFCLQSMHIAPCTACDHCQKGGAGCVINDDMQTVYRAVLSANVLVFASPVYWFSISGQLKTTIDRLYALSDGGWKTLRQKRYAVILTYGDSDLFSSGGINAVRSFEDMFRFLGAPRADFLYGSAMSEGEIVRNAELFEQAFSLGKSLGAAEA